MAINGAYPILTSSVIGMELGIITALTLTPLAYIFLRAGPTRRTPWQVEDVTPAWRVTTMIGNWLADTAVLWLIMICMAFAGVILSFFRLPLADIRPHETILTAILIAAPALAFIAGLRIFFTARPGLRGAGGDVLFFVIWLTGISVAAIYFASGGSASPILDLFGYAASMSGTIDEPINSLAVGSSPMGTKTIVVDGMVGVLKPKFLMSRVFWIIMAGTLAALGGFVFKSRSFKAKNARAHKAKKVSVLSTVGEKILAAVLPKSSQKTAPLWTNIYQLLSPKIFVVVFGILAVAGFFLPFRELAGPAIWLALIFPLTTHSERWQSRNMTSFTSTLPRERNTQFAWTLASAVFLACVMCIPAIIKAAMSSNLAGIVPDLGFIILAVPLISMGLGAATRSAFSARFLLLLMWYVYLNSGA
ncbi:MAG TPA: hypothetical protein ENJ46_02075 [Hellea balneolensis]|uniref:Uncharacterized protein n=1 Tax=Hellea balneolensis TaxID=287478 RepID=A0A7C3C3X1_9PROT|nr:hypothetical protein [Hellea balneolensis]